MQGTGIGAQKEVESRKNKTKRRLGATNRVLDAILVIFSTVWLVLFFIRGILNYSADFTLTVEYMVTLLYYVAIVYLFKGVIKEMNVFYWILLVVNKIILLILLLVMTIPGLIYWF